MRSNLARKNILICAENVFQLSGVWEEIYFGLWRKYTLVCGENMAAKAGWCIPGGGKPLKPILTPLNLEKRNCQDLDLRQILEEKTLSSHEGAMIAAKLEK